jgi:trans-aconitate methyltransferase
MTNRSSFNSTKFDEYNTTYDIALTRGLSISGEDKDYFARHRIAWLADGLQQLQQQPKVVMDFGCGTGSAIPLLFDLIGTQAVVAIDTSMKCLDVAKRTHDCKQAQFLAYSQYKPSEQID